MFCLFNFITISCLLARDRKGVDVDGKGVQEELGGAKEEKPRQRFNRQFSKDQMTNKCMEEKIVIGPCEKDNLPEWPRKKQLHK